MENNKSSPMTIRSEKKFLAISQKFPEQFVLPHEKSPQEGFEYLYSQMSKMELTLSMLSRIRHLGDGMNIIGRLKIMKAMIQNFKKIFKGKKECYKDLEPYYKKLEEINDIPSMRTSSLLETYPNELLWSRLKSYAQDRWNVKIGFTKLPNQLIFKGKAVLFEYALVCIQEMKKEKIEHAPERIAGAEVMRVYGTLGLAVSDIARWLRSKGFNCQADHPLGGLVNTSPLAGKAGMGWIGRHGLLITPEFGPRVRIAPVFVEGKLFEYTDNQNNRWIEDWCKRCGKCECACPTGAINSEKKKTIEGIPDISTTKTCIDRERCFPYFNKTFGCSVCIKVCPFSQGITTYNRLKNAVKRK